MSLLLALAGAVIPPDPEPTTERVGGAGGLVGKPPRKSTRSSTPETEPHQWGGNSSLAVMMRAAIALIASGALEEFD